MSKANYTTLVLGTVSTLVFALGMCMCMIEQWHAFTQGIIAALSASRCCSVLPR